MNVALLADVVATLESTAGAGNALRALGLAHPLAPPGGVSDYDTRVRLAAFVEGARATGAADLNRITVRAIEAGERFLEAVRRERLRQPATSFNAAITLVLLGTVIILGGAVLLFFERTTAGALTAAVGAVSNAMSTLLFRLNRDANNKLDQIAQGLGKLEGSRRALELLAPESRPEERP